MMRDARTPLILWICAAICVHFAFGGGGVVIADIHDDRVYLHHLASDARDLVRSKEQTVEVALLDSSKSDNAQPEPPPPPPPPPPKPEAKKPEPKPELAKQPKKAEPKPEPKKPAIVVAKTDEKAKPLPPPPPSPDHRIAVKQHAKANQEDNPNAHFIADEANHVDQETVAQLTSHDRDDENPTPGGNHAGPADAPGDSDRTKIADSEEHAGNKDRAPGEKGTEFTIQKDPMPQTPPAAQAVPGPKTAQLPQAGGDGKTAMSTPSPQPQMAPGAAGQQSPEVTQAANGSWTFNPVRPNAGQGVAQEQGPGAAPNKPNNVVPPTSTAWLGLGGRPGPGRINLNLSQQGVVAAVGADQLRKEREADGERRRSEHRGSWIASNFERWRSAIENYVSSVKPGNQTALNTAAVPFASYLNAMHNRIHPIFADSFLESLDSLPANHPLNDQHLITRLEIVLTKDGHLHKMGIVRTSGITAFDIAALDSVSRASPFGPAPAAIVSPDGNVYLHWEFHRDEVYACSTMNARPFLLNVPPKGDEPEPQPPTPTKPSGPQERGIPANTSETREGLLATPPRTSQPG